MSTIRWPLLSNTIRQGLVNHTFGMVRNGGAKAHQGWDFYAEPGTKCFAISDGTVVHTGFYGSGSATKGFGKMVIVKFEFEKQTLYAAYCHLSKYLVNKNDPVSAGTVVGLTGNTGNATSMRGKDQHLHFEVRTTPFPGLGLQGRISPIKVFKQCPLKQTISSPLASPM
jgi:peptidoglycan LD-endopeptidase LytH